MIFKGNQTAPLARWSRAVLAVLAFSLRCWIPACESAAAPGIAAAPAAPVAVAVQSHSLHNVAFTPDGLWLVGGAEDGKVYVWNVADGKNVRTIDSLEPRVQAIHIFADGQLVQTAHKSVKIWSLADGLPR